MNPSDTFFVEIRLRDGAYFPFLTSGEDYLHVQTKVLDGCRKQNATLIQIFNLDVWATAVLPIKI